MSNNMIHDEVLDTTQRRNLVRHDISKQDFLQSMSVAGVLRCPSATLWLLVVMHAQKTALSQAGDFHLKMSMTC